MLRENLPDLADRKLVDAVAEKAANVRRLLRNIARDFAPAVFANSLGAEDMVLTDMIYREGIDIGVFSLDTGRLPEETHALIAATGISHGLTVVTRNVADFEPMGAPVLDPWGHITA